MPREKGIIFNKKPATKTNMIRVPRDNKTPFLIYTPPKYTLKGGLNSQMQIRAKIHPPTLQSISELRQNHPQQPREENIRVEQVHHNQSDEKKVKKRKPIPPVMATQQPVDDLSKWSVEDVTRYLLRTDCSVYAQIFKEQVRKLM